MVNSSPPFEFSLNHQMPLRCGLAIVGASLDLILCALVVYVYFFHPRFRLVLRTDFNTMTVLACMVHGVQAIVRLIASSLLLTYNMTRERCLVTGTLDTSLDTVTLMLMIGFYMCLMSIRLRPCRNVPLMFPKYFNEIAWSTVAISAGILTGYVINEHGEDLTGDNESKSPFGYTIGWCALGENLLLYFVTQGLPVSIYFLCSVLTLAVLRCSCGPGLRIQQSLNWSSHWPIYVRLFGITLLMISSYIFTFLVHFFGHEKHKMMSVSSVMAALWPAGLAFLFALSEGVFHEMPCCGWMCNDPEEEGASKDLRSSLRHSHNSNVCEDAETIRLSTGTNFGLRAPGGGFTSALRTLLGLEIAGEAPITSIRRLEENQRLLFDAR